MIFVLPRARSDVEVVLLEKNRERRETRKNIEGVSLRYFRREDCEQGVEPRQTSKHSKKVRSRVLDWIPAQRDRTQLTTWSKFAVLDPHLPEAYSPLLFCRSAITTRGICSYCLAMNFPYHNYVTVVYERAMY